MLQQQRSITGQRFRVRAPDPRQATEPHINTHCRAYEVASGTLLIHLGTIIALYTLLGVFGALACTFLGDVLGRRITIFIAAAVQLIGALLMTTSYSLGQVSLPADFRGLRTLLSFVFSSSWPASF